MRMDNSAEEKFATIYIVRHGETVGNDRKIMLHPDEDVLNDIGKTQANLLGNTLKDIQFTRVYTSQYPRTKETANIILEQNTKNRSPEVKVDSRLREIGFQSYGKSYQLLLKAIITFLQEEKPVDEFIYEDSEPVTAVRERAKSFIKDLINDTLGQTEPETILIVSHGLWIRVAMEHLSTMQEADASSWDSCGAKIIRNTGYMKLSIKGKNIEYLKIKFETFHNTSHLSKEMLETDSLTRLSQTPEGKCLSGCFQV